MHKLTTDQSLVSHEFLRFTDSQSYSKLILTAESWDKIITDLHVEKYHSNSQTDPRVKRISCWLIELVSNASKNQYIEHPPNICCSDYSVLCNRFEILISHSMTFITHSSV